MSERKGMSLHIGVNYLDKTCYPLEPPHPDYPDGWDGALASCESDAIAMHDIARRKNFDAKLLLSEEATAANVRDEIRRAARTLKSGDIFFLSYAGHGGQVPDISKDERINRNDYLDETWCLHDRQFLDDEQYALYAEFEEGVRILIISDSCHSGTVSRGGPRRGALRPKKKSATARCMPPESVKPIYVARKADYDRIQTELPKVQPGDVKASIRLFAACQDKQEAECDDFAGFFTRAIVETWSDDSFDGSYEDFFAAVKSQFELPSDGSAEARGAGEAVDDTELQIPNHYVQGTPDPEFDRQKPFEI